MIYDYTYTVVLNIQCYPLLFTHVLIPVMKGAASWSPGSVKCKRHRPGRGGKPGGKCLHCISIQLA